MARNLMGGNILEKLEKTEALAGKYLQERNMLIQEVKKHRLAVRKMHEERKEIDNAMEEAARLVKMASKKMKTAPPKRIDGHNISIRRMETEIKVLRKKLHQLHAEVEKEKLEKGGLVRLNHLSQKKIKKQNNLIKSLNLKSKHLEKRVVDTAVRLKKDRYLY